jgi:hypothetical protein
MGLPNRDVKGGPVRVDLSRGFAQVLQVADSKNKEESCENAMIYC